MASRIDEFGTPEAYNHYAVGWAHAMDTPYQWTKQVASHWGGTRNGTIVHWPNGIKAKGETPRPVPPRHRRRPDRPRGGRAPGPDVRQRHPAGAARGRLDDLHLRRRGAADRHTTQYFEMFVQPRHLPPGLDGGHPPLAPRGSWSRRCRPIDDDVWELYGARRLDPGARPRRRAARQAGRAAAAVPDRGRRSTTSCRSTTGGSSGSTPTSPGARSSSTATSRSCSAGWAGSPRTPSSCSRTSRTRSPPQIDRPRRRCQRRRSSAQGGAFGGWAFYLKDGRPAYCYNLFGLQRFKVARRRAAPARRAPGPARVRVRRRRPRQGRHRHALRRRQPGRRGAGRRRPSRCCSRATRPPTSAATPGRQ